MKILILGLPRSGTSSLYDFLRTSLPNNYECKYEPFKTEYIGNFNSNCLIKSVLTNEILLKKNQTLLEHTIELISNFYFVIFLKRDLNDIKISFKKMVNLNKNLWGNQFCLKALTGRTILSSLITEKVVRFNSTELKNGIYVLRVTMKNGTELTKKLIK